MKKLVLQFAVWVIKKLQGKTASITPSDSFSGTGLDDTYLFDFKNYLSSYGGLHTTTASGVGSGMFAEDGFNAAAGASTKGAKMSRVSAAKAADP